MRAGESESKSTYTGEQITHVLLAVLFFFFRKREQEKNIVGACRSHCHHHHQTFCCMWLGAAANLVGVVSVCCELFRLRYTFLDFFWRSRTELGQRTNRTYVLCAILTRAVVTQNFATASSSFFVFVLLEGFCFLFFVCEVLF